MGNVSSVSLPAGITCDMNAPCWKLKKCYADRMERYRRNVREAYMTNYQLLRNEPNTYWREVEATIMVSRFFRFHVSGDIPDRDYLEHIVDIADRNSHCQILCFTKKYSLVNEFLDDGGIIPDNLHLILSIWRDFPFDNPYKLPEAHVRYKDGCCTTTNGKQCGGNCSNCAITDEGCWTLKRGESIVFDEH